MRISDWSSDVCSSDLYPPICKRFVQSIESVIACHRTPSQKCPGNKHHHENECCACGKIHIIPHFPGLQLLNSVLVQLACTPIPGARSEERRVGKECVSTCRSRWSSYP